MVHGRGKSDPAIVAVKPTNKAGQPDAEPAEPRAGAEENVGRRRTPRAQNRERVTQALDRVRRAARQRKKERFTALLHQVNPDTLRLAFYALKRRAAPGVDGVTWQDYEADLEPRLADLHDRVHRGAYRAHGALQVGLTRRRWRQRHHQQFAARAIRYRPSTLYGGANHEGQGCLVRGGTRRDRSDDRSQASWSTA